MKIIKFLTIFLAALGLSVLVSQNVFADSDVRGTLIDTTTATNSAALAIGNGASASIGGIAIENSKFSGTAIATTTATNSVALKSRKR